MKNLLKQNSKLKKSPIYTVNWSLPAIKTCPNAGACKRFCYASKGAFRYGNVRDAHENNYKLSLTAEFADLIVAEINRRKKIKAVRIHDSGDFYNAGYLAKWIMIAERLPHVRFYAYSKSIALIKSTSLPNNFTVILSEGGLQDDLINTETDRHARIFKSAEDLKADGYTDASSNDSVALLSSSNKIGLIAH